ncbi:MAG: hypothetical protein ACREQ5_08470 [Candidatus Dormibacteria bacterium]
MQETSQELGRTWPTATKEWGALMSSKRKDSDPTRRHWTPEQHYLMANFDLLVKEHAEGKVTLHALSRKYGFSTHYLSIQFKKRGIKHNTWTWKNTQPERKLTKVLDAANIVHQVNDRIQLDGRELDVYIPSHQIGIEVNGLYWHNENIPNKITHLAKLDLCKSKSIDLLQFWDSEINDQLPIVMSIIMNRLNMSQERIHARKCQIKEVPTLDARSFLEHNHIQGSVNSKVRLGLYHNDVLVALMTFGKSRLTKSSDWELVRYCSLLNHTIVGGSSKLFHHFIKTFQPKSIVSYSDRRLFGGAMYTNLDFTLSHISKPNYWYFNSKEYWPHSRIAFQKHKLVDKLATFDPDKTETENMEDNGWLRIKDCGNMVWKWKQ